MAKYEWNGSEFNLKENQGIKANDLKKVKKIIDDNQDIILERWGNHFDK